MFLSFFPQQKFRHTLFLSTPYRHSSSASLQVRFAFAPLPGDRECRVLLGSGLLEPARVNAMNRFPTLPQPTSETRSLLSALSCAVVFILRTFEDPRALSLLSEVWMLPVAQTPLRGPPVLSQCVQCVYLHTRLLSSLKLSLVAQYPGPSLLRTAATLVISTIWLHPGLSCARSTAPCSSLQVAKSLDCDSG